MLNIGGFGGKLFSLVTKGSERGIVLKKNIIGTFLVKSMSIITSLLFLRYSLDFLGKEVYGVWLTMSAFVTWFTFFELGLGNGLRNKLAESIVIGDVELSRSYVSTTYFLLCI